MDVILTFTKANIKKGWQNNRCPVHRALSKAFHTSWSMASSSGFGYSLDGKEHALSFSPEDRTYLIEVMRYADRISTFNDDITLEVPKPRKVVAHVDN